MKLHCVKNHTKLPNTINYVYHELGYNKFLVTANTFLCPDLYLPITLTSIVNIFWMWPAVFVISGVY